MACDAESRPREGIEAGTYGKLDDGAAGRRQGHLNEKVLEVALEG